MFSNIAPHYRFKMVVCVLNLLVGAAIGTLVWHGMGNRSVLNLSVILYGLLALFITIVVYNFLLKKRDPNRLPPIAYASAIVSGLTVLILTMLGIGR